MSVGALARKVLGPRWFPRVAAGYRSLFVSVEKVADSVPALPPRAEILDVGGGDGAVLNALLRRLEDPRATMIDIGTRIGGALDGEWARRVRLLPGVSLRQYGEMEHAPPDLIVVSDVLHHVPPAERTQLFVDLRDFVAGRRTILFVKDVEPGSWRAGLGYLADRYVSGDRGVSLISEKTVGSLLAEAFPDAAVSPTNLSERDPPNYALVCRTR